MELKVFTAFSGYDSQCMALDRLHEHNPDFTYELVGWAEIDKYAIEAHNAVYPQWADRNFGDISKIDWQQVPDFDLFTYSSPCQDFSQAGKQAGGVEGSGTRSSLLWECRRAILAKKPKYLLMENVAALVSQKFIRLFNQWQLELESYGYCNFAKVLNAKDYGVPQNRERIFMVSVLDESFRYEFPKPIPLTLRLKDVLESQVDERYYLSQQAIDGFDRRTERNAAKGNGFGWKPTEGEGVAFAVLATSQTRMDDNYVKEPIIYDDYNGKVREDQDTIGTITTNCGTKAPRNGFKIVEPKCMVVGNIYESQGQNGDVFDTEGLAPTLRSGQGIKGRGVGSCNSPKVIEPFIGSFKSRNPDNPSERKKTNGMYQQRFEPNAKGLSNTITGVQKDNVVVEPINTDKEGNAVTINAGYYKYGSKTILGGEYGTSGTAVMESSYRIRKLTERECFRLMDMPEQDIDKIQAAGICRSQQYKMAGNSIVVACLYHIFHRLFIETQPTELTLF